MKVVRTGICICGWVLGATTAGANSHPPQLVVKASALAPVARFNLELEQARRDQLPWTSDYREIARRFAIPKEPQSADIVTDQRRYDTVYVDVLTSASASPQAEGQALYMLQLKRRHGQWQLEQARVAWRCHDDATFSTARCSLPAGAEPPH